MLRGILLFSFRLNPFLLVSNPLLLVSNPFRLLRTPPTMMLSAVTLIFPCPTLVSHTVFREVVLVEPAFLIELQSPTSGSIVSVTFLDLISVVFRCFTKLGDPCRLRAAQCVDHIVSVLILGP
jgi:hypothetical protein